MKTMKTTNVTVPFRDGLHMREASKLVQCCKAFRSRVFLRHGHRIVNAKSILSILLLCATFSAQLQVMADGEDEDAAIQAAEVFFQGGHNPMPPPAAQSDLR